MSSNQYGSTLYRTHASMVDAVVEDWLTGCGGGPALVESLAEQADNDAIADEMIADGWIACGCNGGDGPDDDGDHKAGCLEGQGVDRDDVISAIERLRERVATEVPAGGCILAGEAFGHYHIHGNADVEDWTEVQADSARVERIEDLTGWAPYTAAYRVHPLDEDLPALTYFVAEPA